MAVVAMISAEWNNLVEVTYSTNCSISSANKRTGNYGFCLNAGATSEMYRVFSPPPSEAYLQFGWRGDPSLANNRTFFAFRSGTASLICIKRNASNLLEIRSGWDGALLATGITPILNATWYVIELHFKLADTGGVAELRVDGNLECAFYGDTKPGAETTFDQMYWYASSGGYGYVLDDVVLHDTAGSANNSWPGGVKLGLLKPTSDGAAREWTPSYGSDHYTLVDEVPPSGTDYLRAAANDLIDLFGLEDLPAEAQSVKAVALDFFGLKGSTVAPTRIAQIANLSGTDYVQGDQDLPLAQGLVRKILDTNPAGGNWSVATVNAMLSGIKSRA
ncbi:MAG: hypothetical protein A3K23_00270 [Desulfobacca sp. RBG_16_58_9]|nr:MAG: hypothetical protein A3K23_00270 [Desulfobacca sp. RBG_16_58_9]